MTCLECIPVVPTLVSADLRVHAEATGTFHFLTRLVPGRARPPLIGLLLPGYTSHVGQHVQEHYTLNTNSLHVRQ